MSDGVVWEVVTLFSTHYCSIKMYFLYNTGDDNFAVLADEDGNAELYPSTA